MNSPQKIMMWREFKSSADRLVFVACILLGWLALEMVQSLH